MPTIRIDDPVHLVKILPYQLGYHPARSLVAVGLRERRLVLVQRVDLPTEPAAVVAAADAMVRQIRAAHCTAAVVVAFEDETTDDWAGSCGTAGRACDGRAVEGRAAGAQLTARLRETGIPILEHLVVRAGRVYFPECPDGCHPDAGVALPEDRDVAPVADFVALGASPCPTRGHLADRVASADDRTAHAVRAAARRLGRSGSPTASPERALADWGRFLDTTRPAPSVGLPSAAAAARMAAALTDVSVRDLLLTWLCPGTLGTEGFDPRLVTLARARLPGGLPSAAGAPERAGDAERSAALVERLCWLARQAPEDLAPGVLTMLAAYTWWLGDGALADTAVDRALSIDPAYRLARLLEQLVSLGVRPPRAGARGPESVSTARAGSV